MIKIRLFWIVCGVMVSFLVQSQEISRHVVATSGNSSSADDLVLSWTIGQAGLIGTSSQGNLTLSSGFQQGDTIYYSGISENEEGLSLKVYPNPFRENFTIAFDTDMTGDFSYLISDLNGTTLLEKNHIKFHGNGFKELVPAANYHTGVYTLLLTLFTNNTSTQSITIKLIKQ